LILPNETDIILKEKIILDEKEANKENINPIGIYFPIGKKVERKPKWLFWSKKSTKEYEAEEYLQYDHHLPSFEKKPQKEGKVGPFLSPFYLRQMKHRLTMIKM